MLAILLVCVFAIIDRHDSYNVFALVDPIEETELAYSVSPSLRGVSLEFFDIRSVVGLFSNLRINVFLEF